jgi:hypothetical protein
MMMMLDSRTMKWRQQLHHRSSCSEFDDHSIHITICEIIQIVVMFDDVSWQSSVQINVVGIRLGMIVNDCCDMNATTTARTYCQRSRVYKRQPNKHSVTGRCINQKKQEKGKYESGKRSNEDIR